MLCQLSLPHDVNQTLSVDVQTAFPVLAALAPRVILKLVGCQPLSLVVDALATRATTQQIGVQDALFLVTTYCHGFCDGGRAGYGDLFNWLGEEYRHVARG